MEESAQGVQSRLGDLLKMAKLGVSDPSLLDKIAKASKNLNDAVAQLLLANDCASGLDSSDIPSQVKVLREGVIMIERNPGKKPELMAGAKAVTASSTQVPPFNSFLSSLMKPYFMARDLRSPSLS